MRAPALMSGLLLAVVMAGCGRFVPRAALPVEPPSWLGAGGSSTRSYSDHQTITVPLAPRWTAQVGRGVLAPPATGDGVVYLATVDRKIVALDLADGRRRWIKAFRGSFRAAPCIAGPVLYAVTDSPEGILRCLGARRGELYWGSSIGPAVSSPALSGGVVVAGTTNGRILAIDRERGRTIWERALRGPLVGSTVVTDSLVIVATLDGMVRALRLADGECWWECHAAGGIEADLAWAGETLLVGSLSQGIQAWRPGEGEAKWEKALPAGCVAVAVDGEAAIGLGPDGTLVALRISDGGLLWTQSLPGVYRGALAAGGGAVVVGGMDGRLRVVDVATGAIHWTWDGREPITVPPLLWQGTVLVASARGRVTLLEPAPGAPASREVLTRESPAPVAPGVAESPGIDQSEVTLFTRPYGATVSVGERSLGLTPVSIRLEGLRGDTLRLSYPQARTLALPADSLLAARPPLVFSLFPEADSLARARSAGSRSVGSRSWGRRAAVACLGALASGGMAIYCRDRADDEFDRYLRTGRLPSMRRHFRAAERWDTLSVVAWGASQVATAITIYCLVRHDREVNRPIPREQGWQRQSPGEERGEER